jgi:hypothetical protein
MPSNAMPEPIRRAMVIMMQIMIPQPDLSIFSPIKNDKYKPFSALIY